MPHIDDLFDPLFGSLIFSFLGFSQGYHQIKILDEDILKLYLRLHLDNQFRVLSLDGQMHQQLFKGCMIWKIQKYFGKFALVHLDDILVFFKSTKHTDHENE